MSSNYATVGSVLRFLFPDHGEYVEIDAFGNVRLPPIIDMFAAAAYLCRLGGVAGLVDPSSHERFLHDLEPLGQRRTIPKGPDSPEQSSIRVSKDAYRAIIDVNAEIKEPLYKVSKLLARSTLFEAELKQMRRLRGFHAGRPLKPQHALTLKRAISKKLEHVLSETIETCSNVLNKHLAPFWKSLISKNSEALSLDNTMQPGGSAKQSWLQAALDILIITDALSVGVSAPHDWSSGRPVASYPALLLSIYSMNDVLYRDEHKTLSFEIPRSVLVTQPKCRTPVVGSSLRSLTHNLTILPASGTTTTKWDYSSRSDKPDRSPLNILVIPIPYYLHAKSFQPLTDHIDGNWNYFRISPDWSKDVPPNYFVNFVKDLCSVAVKDIDKIDAVVLPECAITHEQYDALETAIADADVDDVFYEIEFIVAGTSSRKQDGRPREDGNFVLYSTFAHSNQHMANVRPAERGALRVSHAKHHRWKLHDQQIDDYRLSHVLNKGMSWWEYLPPNECELEVVRFRNTQSLMTLICEDLARVDPGQEVVRCIGPDLLIALLMDSAQISSRWPARYATVLAEDPGSSVLTVTSAALVHRANEERVRKARAEKRTKCPELSNSIGLWKDERTWSGIPITLEKDSEAVVLTISNKHREQRSLDGRSNSLGQHWLWQLTDQRQVRRSLEEQIKSPPFGRIFGDDGWAFDINAAKSSFHK
ncbi:MAG: hypothetical protein AAF225_00810 [Pseudomonadota bacterium]